MAKLAKNTEREQALKDVTINIRKLKSYLEWMKDTAKLPDDGYVYKLNFSCNKSSKEGPGNNSTMSLITSRKKLMDLVANAGNDIALQIKKDIKTYDIELEKGEADTMEAWQGIKKDLS